MKRFFGYVVLMFCILMQSEVVMAILSSSSEYYGEYPPAGYQAEHGPILNEVSSNSAAVQTSTRYWSHEPEDAYECILSKTPLREEEGAK